jgi:S-DNA-T family DNA segregation ATPase FtsK/SpoIIIE
MTDLIPKPADATLIDAAARFPRPQSGGVYDQEQDAAVLDSARQVIRGVVLDTPGERRVEKAVDLDAFDDLPLIPAWMRSADGWAQYAGVLYRARRRGFRRWVRRQPTSNGHAAQYGRGARRMQDWAAGLEGVQVQSLHHAAQIAAREAREVNRRARYTPKVLPAKYAKAQAVSVKATAVAESATAAYRKALKERRRIRGLRYTVVYGPQVGAIGGGYVMAGGLAATLGALATFAAVAFAGRHPVTDGTDWQLDWRSLGDGDAMTAPMLDAAFRSAKVIGAEESLRVVRMPMLDERGDWAAVLDLPPGIPAKKAMNARSELASAFGIEDAQLTLSKGGRSGRIDLHVSRELPFTQPAGRGPLLDLEGPTNFWGRISIGPDVRGLAVSISVVERSGLIGGEPGAGKSASGNTILLAAALDPRVILWLADGKGGGDLEPFEPLCEQYEGMADPEAFYEMLKEAIAVMKARYALLKKLGKRKVTEDLAAKHPELRQMLLWVDELMLYTTDDEYGKKITKALRNLVSRGRAAGIITFCATQKPGSDVVDTSLRDLLSIRWALRCTTPEASDTILGRGAAASGYSAKSIESEMRGAGYLWSEGTNPQMVRADYYSDEQVNELIEFAVGLRAKAGTLPTAPASLADQLREQGDDHARILAVLLDTFDAHPDDEGQPAEWLPGAVLLDALAAAGLDVSADSLGRLVVRTDEEKAKRPWQGSRVVGYPRSRTLITVRDRYGLSA